MGNKNVCMKQTGYFMDSRPHNQYESRYLQIHIKIPRSWCVDPTNTWL